VSVVRAFYIEGMEWDLEIDALGLLCPLPVLRLRKRMQPLAEGSVIRLLASDPAAQIDVPHFCSEGGHEYLGADETGGHTAYFIRKGGAAPL
jgi:tRNA 2-thiouridine synthesizing protein A